MKKNKNLPILGTLIGMGLWGSLAYVLYPHWSAWIFGGLLTILTLALLKALLFR
jgi:hypothetical protein